jgi:HlyD family secretion protein
MDVSRETADYSIVSHQGLPMAQDIDNALTKLRIDRTRKRPRRSGGRRFLLLAVAIVAVVAACSFYNSRYSPVPVKITHPEVEKSGADGAEVLIATGYVIPRRTVEVSSKIIGRVKEMNVDRGQTVKQGDVLLVIDDEEYQAQVKQADALVASSEALLAELKAGSRPEEIKASKSAVAAAEARLVNARQDYDRLDSLRKQDVISQQELDRATAALDVAKADLKAATEQYKLVQKGPRQEQIDAAAAQLNQAKAGLDYARTQLGYTIIRAPISGTILEKVAEKGELVTNINLGGTRGAKSSAVSMADLNDLQVEIDVNEGDVPKVRLQQECRIKMDSVPGEVFQGRVDEMAPGADRQKATVQVKVAILDPRGLIRPEVNAQVTFLADKSTAPQSATPAKAKVWIAKTAFVQDTKNADGHIVYLAMEGKAVARPIKIGAEEGPKGFEVLEGLDGSESIITEPLDKITDGRRITVPK